MVHLQPRLNPTCYPGHVSSTAQIMSHGPPRSNPTGHPILRHLQPRSGACYGLDAVQSANLDHVLHTIQSVSHLRYRAWSNYSPDTVPSAPDTQYQLQPRRCPACSLGCALPVAQSTHDLLCHSYVPPALYSMLYLQPGSGLWAAGHWQTINHAPPATRTVLDLPFPS